MRAPHDVEAVPESDVMSMPHSGQSDGVQDDVEGTSFLCRVVQH